MTLMLPTTLYGLAGGTGGGRSCRRKKNKKYDVRLEWKWERGREIERSDQRERSKLGQENKSITRVVINFKS